MESKENRVRLNCYMVPDVKKYLDEQSDAYGMSISAYLTMIIQQHRFQNSTITTMEAMMKKLDEIEKAAVSK